MKINWKKLTLCIIIPLAVGGLSALLTMDGMKEFASINKPPLSPPDWLFPIAWTILYVLMGIASYLVLTADAQRAKIQAAFWVYAVQLLLNFLWTIIFFCFDLYWYAFIWVILLLIAIVINIISFYNINKTAGYLLIPYAAWVTFASYLTLGVAMLN